MRAVSRRRAVRRAFIDRHVRRAKDLAGVGLGMLPPGILALEKRAGR